MKKLNESERPSPNICLTVWRILRVLLTKLANDHQKQPHIHQFSPFLRSLLFERHGERVTSP